jgi:hypothetical protein
MVPLRVLSRTNLADTSRRSAPNRRSFNALQPLCRSWRSFSHGLPLFSIACSLFLQNTGGWYPDPVFGSSAGVKRLQRRRSNYGTTLWVYIRATPLLPPSYAPRGASIPSGLSRLRILSVTTGVYCRRAVSFSRSSDALSASLSLATRHSPLPALRCYHKLHET